MRKRTLLFVALLAMLALPIAQSSPSTAVSPALYTVLADGTADASGGHGTGTNIKVTTPHKPNNQAGRRSTSPSSGALGSTLMAIVAALVSSIGL